MNCYSDDNQQKSQHSSLLHTYFSTTFYCSIHPIYTFLQDIFPIHNH